MFYKQWHCTEVPIKCSAWILAPVLDEKPFVYVLTGNNRDQPTPSQEMQGNRDIFVLSGGRSSQPRELTGKQKVFFLFVTDCNKRFFVPSTFD